MKPFIIFASLLSLIPSAAKAQELPTMDQIKTAVLANWDRVEDYEVDMNMSIDLPGFRMPNRNVHYLYKAPDKVKVDVQGFAVVPREGIQPFTRFFNDSLELEVIQWTEINGQQTIEVAFQDTFQSTLAGIRLWVDLTNGTVPRGIVEFDGKEMFKTETSYAETRKGIWLPSQSEITLTLPPDFKRMQNFGKMPTEIQQLDREIRENPEWVEGSILLDFKKYRVNKGIPDWVFEEETEGYE